MKTFEQLGIHKDLVKGLKDQKIINPTEIQETVIPLLLKSSTDLIGRAQTGTGKTAAFGLPLLQRVDTSRNEIQGLILCPTRELGKQIGKELFKFTKYTDKVFTEVVYGGEKIDIQIGKLRRPTHILVATPGRLIDLVKRKAVDLRKVKTIVLDEADEMLSMGFKKQLDEILTFLHSAEAKWLFSATLPKGIREIVDAHLKPDAHRIEVSRSNVVNENIQHQYLICQEKDKFEVLQQFLKSQGKGRGVIFCRTKTATKTLTAQLQNAKISADGIEGDMQQKERDKVMRAFRSNKLQIMVATDLAARGIDVEDLKYVLHYQLPDQDEYYTHRSGRTARAGKEGVSLALVTAAEVKQLRYYEKVLKIKFRQIREVR